MSEIAKLDIDATPISASVGRATKALDELLKAMESLAKGGGEAHTALVKKLTSTKLENGVKTQAETLRNAAAQIEADASKAQNYTNRRQLNLVAQLNKDLQQRFEEFATQQLAANKGLTVEMLKTWSSSGANISKEQKKWLKDQLTEAKKASDDRLANFEIARRLELQIEKDKYARLQDIVRDNLRFEKEAAAARKAIAIDTSEQLKFQADADNAARTASLVKASAFAKEQMALAMANSGSYTKYNGSTGAVGEVQAGGAAAQAVIAQKLATENSVKNINSQLEAMRLATTEKLKLAKLEDAATAKAATAEAQKTEALVKGINSQLAVIRAGNLEKLKLQEAYQLDVLKDIQRFESEKAAMIRTSAASFISGPFKGQRMDTSEVTAYQTEMTKLKPRLAEAALATKKLTDSHISLKGALSEGNAAMRGFTQGIGTMSAGMYSMLPFMASFLAGAAVMKTLKVGAEFQTSMFVIGELAGNSQESMVKLRESVLALSDNTQYGPLELAKGLEVLTLAGLSATAAMEGLQPTLQFASATAMPVEKAAETLVAVQTAYKFTVDGFATIGDLIAKTAADTMSSGASMAEAFRTASVVAQQYKLTLEDTAVTLGMLANIGIQGSAAGTSYRNMITELNKGSGKAAEGVKALGAEIQNLDGSTRHIMDVMKDLSVGLVTRTGAAQQRLLQDMTNERGAKAMAAFQSQMLTFLNAANPQLQAQADALFKIGDVLGGNKVLTDAVTAAYGEMKAKMEESVSTSAAFNFLADLEKRLTASAQFAGIGASLEKAFVQAFEKVGDSAYILGDRIREIFKSDNFNGGLVQLTSGVLSLVEGLIDLGDWIAANKDVISGLAVGFGLAAMYLLGPVGVVAGSIAVIAGLKEMTVQSGTLEQIAEQNFKKEKLRLETSIKANEIRLKDSQTQIDTQIESQTKLLAKLRDKDKAEEDSIKAAGEAHLKRIEQVYDEKLALIELIRLQTVLTGMRKDGANAIDVIAGADSTAKIFSGQALTSKFAAMDKAETQMYQLIYLAKEVAKVNKENARLANVTPVGIEDKDGYKGKGGKQGAGTPPEYFKLMNDSVTETNLKFYNTELTMLASHEANKRKILDASHSNKLISEGTYAGESLALTAKTEANELALIEAAKLRRLKDYGDDYTKIYKQVEAARAKGIYDAKAEKEVNAALLALDLKAGSDRETLEAKSAKIRDTADTRTQIARDKQIAGLKELDRESAKFWADEAIRQAKVSSSAALEDSLRYASPEAAARISAMATEQDYWNSKIAEQEASVKAATTALWDYQSALIANNLGTVEAVQGEESLVAALTKKEALLNRLRGYSTTAVDKAGEAAVKVFNKKEQAELVKGVSGAIETALVQGGEAGKNKLREVVIAELMKPISLMINAFVNPIMGAVSGALGINGLGSAVGTTGSSGLGLGGALNALTLATSTFASNAASVAQGLYLGAGELSSLGFGEAISGSLGAIMEGSFAAGFSGLAGILGPIGLGLALIPAIGGMFDGGHEETVGTGITGKFSSAGFAGTSYQDWHNAGSSGFFGIGASGSSNGRNRSALDAKVTKGLSDSFIGMQAQITGFAETLGLSTVGLQMFSKSLDIPLGGDKTANEEAIAKAMATLGEEMSKTVKATWSDLVKKPGEETLETLSRLATSLTTVRNIFESMGKTLDLVGISGAVTASQLVDVFGSIEALTTGYTAYYDKFYTSQEKITNSTKALSKALTTVGVSMPTVGIGAREAYRALVDSQDLTTESGRKATAALVAMSGTFDTIVTSVASMTDSITAEVARIRGLSKTAAGGQSFAKAKTEFAVATAQARAGDTKALALLPSLSQALLGLAGDSVHTLAELRTYQNEVADSLEKTSTWTVASVAATAAAVAIKTTSDMAAAAAAAAATAAEVASATAAAATNAVAAVAVATVSALESSGGSGTDNFASNYSNTASLSDAMSDSMGTLGGGLDSSGYGNDAGGGYGFGGGFGSDAGSGAFGGADTYASGGRHSGGYRLVGEYGPELEATGPSRIFSANQTQAILSGSSDSEEVAGLLRAILEKLGNVSAETRAIAVTNQKMAKLNDKWDINGITVVTDAASPLLTETAA